MRMYNLKIETGGEWENEPNVDYGKGKPHE
jgi:hypothetical protein